MPEFGTRKIRDMTLFSGKGIVSRGFSLPWEFLGTRTNSGELLHVPEFLRPPPGA